MTGADDNRVARLSMPTVPSVTRIKIAVAAEYGVSVIDLESDRRALAVARPRQAAMWLCRRLTGRSLPEIGRMFGGRDHTTVMHACKTVERRLADPDERERLTRLLGTVGDGAELWTGDAARADWALREVHELMRDVAAIQERLRRFALALSVSTGTAKPSLEAAPAPAPAIPARAVEDEPPPPERSPGQAWRCRTAACHGTRQPGRDRCAECITAAAISGGAPDAASSPVHYARRGA